MLSTQLLISRAKGTVMLSARVYTQAWPLAWMDALYAEGNTILGLFVCCSQSDDPDMIWHGWMNGSWCLRIRAAISGTCVASYGSLTKHN